LLLIILNIIKFGKVEFKSEPFAIARVSALAEEHLGESW